MSRPERRKQLELEADERRMTEAREYDRKQALTMWERIEESNASEDIKEILHLLAEKVGLEQ
jgi:hypothetical protein